MIRGLGMTPILSYITGAVLALLGLRLVWQAVSLGKLAEGLLGVFLIASGGGMGVALFGIHQHLGGDTSAFDIFTRWGMFFLTLGMVANAEFVRRSFRPDDAWAKVLVLLLSVALFAGWYRVVFTTSYGYVTEPHPAAFGPRLAVYLWGIFESFRTFRTHKKRMALGLADPVVVNRFLLFVTWNLLLIAAPASNAVLRTTNPDAVAALYKVFPIVIGSLLAVVTVLIFFPPNAYLDWVGKGYKSELEGEA